VTDVLRAGLGLPVRLLSLVLAGVPCRFAPDRSAAAPPLLAPEQPLEFRSAPTAALTLEPPRETVGFSLDGTSYEVDLCPEEAAGLRRRLGPYLAAGREQARQDIRAWARSNGYPVGDRGRLPQAVVAAYNSSR